MPIKKKSVKKPVKKPVKKTKKPVKKTAAKRVTKKPTKVTKLRAKPKPKPRAKPKLGNDPIKDMSAYGAVSGRFSSAKSNLANGPKPLALGTKVAAELKKAEQLVTAPKVDYVPGPDDGNKGAEVVKAMNDYVAPGQPTRVDPTPTVIATVIPTSLAHPVDTAGIDDQALADETIEDAEGMIQDVEKDTNLVPQATAEEIKHEEAIDAPSDDNPDEDEDEEEVEECEGCGEPATHHDIEGVPLCKACYDSNEEDAKKENTSNETDKSLS